MGFKYIESKFLLRSCEGTNVLFHEMFPDRKIAHSVSLSRAKCNYILNFGLGPFFKAIFLIETKKSPYFTTKTSERTNGHSYQALG